MLGEENMFFNDIETERLILKNISMEDREFIFSQFSDNEVNRYLFDAEPLTNLEEADEIIRFYTQKEPRAQHRWIIVRKSDGVKIGTCGFHCWNHKECKVEVGYDLKEEFWGNGYMLESMKTIIEFAKDKMHIKEITACIYVENLRSIHLVEKFDFALSGSSYEVFRGKKYLHNRYMLGF